MFATCDLHNVQSEIILFPAEHGISPAALAATPYASLRAAGLSNAKARYIHDLAAKVATGVVDLDLHRASPTSR
jgi:3-methyladenine DNA glycosylase/8-oxoguanine DNA glycosylase